jgi:fructosamine-3-kinase
MTTHDIKELLHDRISKYLNIRVNTFVLQPVGGGSINDCYQIGVNGSTKFFLKLNSASKFPGLFEKEKSGLQFLATGNVMLTPTVLLVETKDDIQLLLLEWIVQDTMHESFWKQFGRQLALLHNISQQYFGFSEDNYMGSLPQVNTINDSWADFFTGCRLRPQIELAAQRNLLSKENIAAFEALFGKLNSVFNEESPSLLHGDLWSGNFLCGKNSMPVLIDPAVYFGHRSVDLAMTTLFGGFDRAFYESYNYHHPFPPNYKEQWEICNLYPLLVHLNLFGQSYLPAIVNTIKRFA